MNLPNQLTLARIFLTVLFVFLVFAAGFWMKFSAFAVFVLAALTDYWDGKLARERGEITPFGQLADPIADKLLTLSAFIAFVQMAIVPAWMVVLIIIRDVLVTGVRLSIPESQKQRVAAHPSGKHKTALQMAAIIAILIFLILKETAFWNAEWTPGVLSSIFYAMCVVAAVTISSGIHYLATNRVRQS